MEKNILFELKEKNKSIIIMIHDKTRHYFIFNLDNL
jgi:hypothetical protein